jgi:hypothetical protein
MTAARVAKLEALGFARQMSAAAISTKHSEGKRDDTGWEGWLAKLEAYKREHGDCSVPLGSWVNSQRLFKRKLDRGDPSLGMTAARVAKLEALGFAWSAGTGSAPRGGGRG